jgi:hypothetical protein
LPENCQWSRAEQARRTTVEHHRSRVAPLPNPLGDTQIAPRLFHRILDPSRKRLEPRARRSPHSAIQPKPEYPGSPSAE